MTPQNNGGCGAWWIVKSSHSGSNVLVTLIYSQPTQAHQPRPQRTPRMRIRSQLSYRSATFIHHQYGPANERVRGSVRICLRPPHNSPICSLRADSLPWAKWLIGIRPCSIQKVFSRFESRPASSHGFNVSIMY